MRVEAIAPEPLVERDVVTLALRSSEADAIRKLIGPLSGEDRMKLGMNRDQSNFCFSLYHKLRPFVAAVLVMLFAFSAIARASDPIVSHLQDASVTINTGFGQGSGVMFTRGDRTFVWTAAHVVDSLRKTRTVVVNGSPKTVVEFGDVGIVQEFRESGRRIGETKMDARVVRFSDADTGEDLALLEIRKRNFTTTTVEFCGDEIPELGTELYHVGSLHGQVGSNSLTTGVISQIGRVLDLGANGVVFDQTSATAFPGSSGGGVFVKADGRYIGMLVRGAGEQFNFIVPVRRMRAWANRAGVAWAMDTAVAMPTDDELAKLPIEDNGSEFDPFKSETDDEKLYPVLLERRLIPTLAFPGEHSILLAK